jgi:hypothetical protein
MDNSITAKIRTPLFEELDALVDQSIDSMSSKQLKEFEKKRKKIMSKVRCHAIDLPALRESEEQATPVLQA